MIDYKGNNVKICETEEGIVFTQRFCWADLPQDELFRLISGGKIEGVYTFRGSVYMVTQEGMTWRLVKITGTGSGQEIKIMSMTENGISWAANAIATLAKDDNA